MFRPVKTAPITLARDCDHWEYEYDEEYSREGSEEGDDY